jgi:glycerol-3-phosphate acyltransferase PlsY
MHAFTLCLIVLVAYLLGSIPFGYLLVRIFRSEDIRKSGSGNIGATNVVRSGARGLGAATFLLDVIKGFVAVAVARELVLASLPVWPPIAQLAWQGSPASRLDTAAAVAAMAAVLGHIYPVWLGFKGGKGVATAFGALTQLAPIAALLGLLVFMVTVLISRYVSLASILGALTIPTAALLLPTGMWVMHPGSGLASLHFFRTPHPLGKTIALLLLPVIVIARHHANIRRLLAGTEYRFGHRRPPAA